MMQIFLFYIRCELHFLKSNDFKPHLYLMDLRLSWIVGTVDHQTQTGYFCPRVQLTKKDCVVGLVHRTLFLQLKANFTCDSLWWPLLWEAVLLHQFRSVLVFLLKNVDIRGIELLKWDTAHPTVRSSSPEVSWCSCFIQWVNTGPVSSFGLFIFTIFWLRGAASSARLGVICLHSHQQMESEMFRLFLQAPLNVLHLLNQIWMWCFFVLNDPFKLL